MAYPEQEGREMSFDESRSSEFNRLRAKYSSQLTSIMQSPFGENLATAERMFYIFLRRGQVPHPTHLLDKYGKVEPELGLGIALLASKELVLNRLSKLGSTLESPLVQSVDIPVTDGLPQFTLRMRSMFPPEADAEVMGICQNGLVDGWNTMLDVLGRQDVPLAMFSKPLGQHLARKTAELFPDKEGIVLPTAISGVQARYDYSNEFTLPYVSLTVEPSQAA